MAPNAAKPETTSVCDGRLLRQCRPTPTLPWEVRMSADEDSSFILLDDWMIRHVGNVLDVASAVAIGDLYGGSKHLTMPHHKSIFSASTRSFEA